MTPEELRIVKEKFNALARKQRAQREAVQAKAVPRKPLARKVKNPADTRTTAQKTSDSMKKVWEYRVAPEGYIGTKEIEKRYGRARSGIQAATRRGRLHPIYSGRVAYYTPEEIERYISETSGWRQKLGKKLTGYRWGKNEDPESNNG